MQELVSSCASKAKRIVAARVSPQTRRSKGHAHRGRDSQARGLAMPRRFRLHRREIEVVEVLAGGRARRLGGQARRDEAEREGHVPPIWSAHGAPQSRGERTALRRISLPPDPCDINKLTRGRPRAAFVLLE